jgi:hypothetical protein
MRKENNRKKK